MLAHEHDLLENNSCPYTMAAWLDILVLFESFALKEPSLGRSIAQSALSLRSAVRGGPYDIAPLTYAKPVVRSSLGLHQALQWLLRVKYGISGQVAFDLRSLAELCLHLRTEYPSACQSVMETLVNLAPHIPLPAVSIFGNALGDLACITNDKTVQTTGRRLLALLYSRMGKDFSVVSDNVSASSMRYSYSMGELRSPSLMENTLLLWGLLNEQVLCVPPPNFDALWIQDLSSFVSALRPLLHESRVNILATHSESQTNDLPAI
jgi:hypothetical protein